MLAGNRPEDDDGGTIIDDGLSTCDEDEEQPYHQRITSAQAAANRAAAKQYKYFTLFLLFVAFFISVIVATVRYYGNPRMVHNENGGGWGLGWRGDGLKEKENALRFQQTLEYLIKFDVSDPKTLHPESNFGYGVLGIEYSPQFRAAHWISKEDQVRITIPSTSGPSREEYPFVQRYALAVFFFATGGHLRNHWILKMNFLSGLHECDWNSKHSFPGIKEVYTWGVSCDGNIDSEGGQDDLWLGKKTVTNVSLPPGNDLWGTLPPELQHLRYLKELDVAFNGFLYGTIPFQFGWLYHLRKCCDESAFHFDPDPICLLKNIVDLSYNALSENNQLNGNTVEGDLDFLQDTTSLTFLTLDYNGGITGTLPDFISQLSNLKLLGLSNTQMYGTLPSSLSTLKELNKLYLDDCAFEGSVDVMQNMSNLTHVYLERNMFNDTIDSTFFAEMENLVHLDVSNCSFSGPVPGHLLKFSQLEVLDMSMNKLDGELPAEVISDTEQSRLHFLSLHTNNITGPIPTSIGLLKNLTTLDLSLNQFTGDIPVEIGKLVDLDIMFLGRNNFNKAPVPDWLRGLTQLTELSLKNSNLNETIPTWLGELSNLTFLDLGENHLTNTIPQSLGNLAELMVLILNSNNLRGELGLGQLEKLVSFLAPMAETLLIDDNSLTGNTNEMCAHTITHFVADCYHNIGDFDMPIDVALDCACCTSCCFDENTTCNDSEWLGNHEGLWEYGYDRLVWDFDEGGVSPHIDYNFWQQ
ncbi:hypothetical protein ACHAXR_007034 [Thalassiosira sp. AJA248-18]